MKGRKMEFHGKLDRMTTVKAPVSRYHSSGKFGRLFPGLPAFAEDTPKVREKLKEIGAKGSVMDGGFENPEHPGGVTAGFTFLGQFIDHDITFDPTSDIESQNDPEAIANFRTPLLELDSVYGSGPGPSPFLYDQHGSNANEPAKDQWKMLIDQDWPNDLPRNSQDRALIGDPRNDENTIINQLHLAFLKFHNAVIDHLRDKPLVYENTLFREAQRVVRWHYQWIVVKEFLPLVVGPALVGDILHNGRKVYKWNNEPYIPVEFSVAAYGFGHTMVRGTYQLNENFNVPIFNTETSGKDPDDLRGGVRPDSPENYRRYAEFDRLFQFNGSSQNPRKSARFDTNLATPLFELTGLEEDSLAARNLERSLAFSLPSGQDIARCMGVQPLSPEDLKDLAEWGFDRRTPLWFYILREADACSSGATLGPVGGRVVAEVLIGLLDGDRNSFRRRDPDWKPNELDFDESFSMTDLLTFAGVPLSSNETV